MNLPSMHEAGRRRRHAAPLGGQGIHGGTVWRSAAFLVAMLAATTAHALPMRTLTLADPSATTQISLTVEIAATPKDREVGLMNRPALPQMSGMLFIFPAPGQVGFWMHNTLIPLDMLFLREGEVVAIHPNALPMTETIIRSPPDIDHVLEVNGGWTHAHGVTPGWTAELSAPTEPSPGPRK